MALTNASRIIDVAQLNYFEGKLAAKYQTQAITAITGLTATTVEGAISELLGKINGLPSAIIPKGSKAFAGLAPSTDLVAANLGFMWNITDAFTTTADFAEGVGHSIPAGANVYVANVGTAAEPSYKYDIFSGMYDLSGYALKSEMAVEAVSGDSTKKDITLKSGLTQRVVVEHQNISGKADKDTNATTGNIAVFDANGNPVGSNVAPSDLTYSKGDGIDITNNVISADVAAGNGLSINSTSKKIEMAAASASTSGVGGNAGAMSAADKEKLDGLTFAQNSDIDEIFA